MSSQQPAGRSLARVLSLAATMVLLSLAPAAAQDSDFKSDYMTVLQDCANAHGVWSEDSKGYGCTKANCDGKGNPEGGDAHMCTVGCNNDDQCKGHTPTILVGNITILMLLQNGSNVHHDTVEGGGGQSFSHATGNSPPKTTVVDEPPPGGPDFL